MKSTHTYGNLVYYRSRTPAGPADWSMATMCSAHAHGPCSHRRMTMSNWTSLTIQCTDSPRTAHIPLVQVVAQCQAGHLAATVMCRCTARNQVRKVHSQSRVAPCSYHKHCGRYHRIRQRIVNMVASHKYAIHSASNLQQASIQQSCQHTQVLSCCMP